MQKKELRQKVENFVESFCDHNETSMLCIYKLGKDDAVTFCGEPLDMVRPFQEMFECAAGKDHHRGVSEITASILCALSNVVDEDEEKGECYKKILQDIIDGNYDYDDEDDDDEPDKEETFEELVAKLNKMGYYVAKKPTVKPKTLNAKDKKDKK